MANAPFTSVHIEGIQQALAELNKIDPKFRREITKRIKGAGADIINDAPLSGMVRGNIIKGRETSWQTDQVQSGFKVKVGARGSRERTVTYARYTEGVKTHDQQVDFNAKPYQLMVIQQANAAGAIYDHAGRNPGNSTFVTNLNAEAGQEPRAIDKAVERGRVPVTKKVYEVIQDVEKEINRDLRFTYGN